MIAVTNARPTPRRHVHSPKHEAVRHLGPAKNVEPRSSDNLVAVERCERWEWPGDGTFEIREWLLFGMFRGLAESFRRVP